MSDIREVLATTAGLKSWSADEIDALARRIEDVVHEWLRRKARPGGECGLFPERLPEMFEREFGGSVTAKSEKEN